MGEPGVILRAWGSSSLLSAPDPSCLRTLWALSITALGDLGRFLLGWGTE